MSDQTMTCDEECVYADEYLVAPGNCCFGVHPTEAKALTCNILPEITFELPPNEVAKEEKGRKRTRIEDLLALVRDILLPGSQAGATYGPNVHASSPAVIFKSYGSSIQPMIWNPEDLYRNRAS